MKKVKLERSINLNQVRSPNGMIKILILNSQSVSFLVSVLLSLYAWTYCLQFKVADFVDAHVQCKERAHMT